MSVDVCVEHADLLAGLRERHGEVRGERRLADPALAAANGKHACRCVERETLRALLQPATQLRRQCLALLGRHHVETKSNAFDAGHVP